MLALAPSVAAPTLEFGSFGPAHVAQVVEHRLGKAKVPGSNPGVGSNRSTERPPFVCATVASGFDT